MGWLPAETPQEPQASGWVAGQPPAHGDRCCLLRLLHASSSHSRSAARTAHGLVGEEPCCHPAPHTCWREPRPAGKRTYQGSSILQHRERRPHRQTVLILLMLGQNTNHNWRTPVKTDWQLGKSRLVTRQHLPQPSTMLAIFVRKQACTAEELRLNKHARRGWAIGAGKAPRHAGLLGCP